MSIPNTIHGMIHSVQRAERSRVPDAELLRRYHQHRDEAAFAMIVDRYCGLVRATCLRTTGDTHHADDAFQATFLILARKTSTIRRPEALPAWLVRVARHAVQKQRRIPSLDAEPLDTAQSPLDQLTAREFLTMFDEELDRLPVNYRSALLLCLVEGQTIEETARQLGTTHGTVRGWLQRGREKLRKRLSRRGLDLSAVLPAVALYYSTPASAAVHQSLLSMMNGSAVIPANVSALMSGSSLTTMIGSLAVVMFLGVLLAGASLWPRTEEPPTAAASTTQPPASMPIETDPARLPQDAIARIGSASFRHGGEVTALAFSKNNRYLASASPADFENSVRVWEMATGKEKLRVPIASNFHAETVSQRTVAVAFDKEGTQVRVLDWASYRAIDLASGKEVIRYDFGATDNSTQFFPKESVIGTEFSPEGQHYAAVRGNGELVIGDTTTGLPKVTIAKRITLPENQSMPHVNISFSPDGKSVCVPLSTSVVLFDVNTGKHLCSYGFENQLNWKAILTGPVELTCCLTDPEGGKYELQVIDLVKRQVISRNINQGRNGLAISPDGKTLALGQSPLQIIDLNTHQVVHRLPNIASTACLTFSHNARWIARSIVYSGCVMLWDVEKETLHPFSPQGYFHGASFEQDGLLKIWTENECPLYNWRTWRKNSEGPPLSKTSLGTHLSSDRRLSATLEYKKDVQQQPNKGYDLVVSEVASGKEVHRFLVGDYCRHIMFTPDNCRLIGITQRDKIHLWDLENNQEIWSHQLPAHSFGIVGTGDPQLSRDGRWMALGTLVQPGNNEYYAIRAFDLHEKNERALIAVPYFPHGGVCISPDGRLVAGGGSRWPGIPDSDTVFVWEVATGKRIKTLAGHSMGNNSHSNAEIRSQFTPDGRKLLTIDGKGAIRLWELSSGQVLWKSAENHGNPRFSISPDGCVIASSSYGAPVLLWDLYGNAKGSVKPSGTVDLEQLWADLAGDDAGKAFKSIRQLCAVPEQAIKLLRGKITPAKPRAEGAIIQWIKELDSPIFAERERASKELLNLLEEVEPQLRQARAATASDESRRRIDAILLHSGKPSPDRLRQERALDVLEHLGTKEAKQHLEILAKGAPNHALTRDAQDAVERLSSLKAQP